MATNNSKSLIALKKPIIIFYILISLTWLVPTINLFIQHKTASGFKLFLFGLAYVGVLFGVQTYFKNMLMLYQKNLDISVKKNKLKKIS